MSFAELKNAKRARNFCLKAVKDVKADVRYILIWEKLEEIGTYHIRTTKIDIYWCDPMIDYAAEIKERLDTEEVLEAYGIHIDRKGRAVCPFHNDNTPSMQVYSGSRGYHCFACGESGDILTFVQKFFGLSFLKACEKLNNDFSLGLPIGQRISVREQRAMEQATKERKEKRKAEKTMQDRMERDYWAAFDEWARLDGQLRKYRPQAATEPLNPLFVEALQRIGLADERLTQADLRRRGSAYR